MTTLGTHEVVPHLIAAAEDCQRSLDWPSATQEYHSRMAPSPGQQQIWELPPIDAAPSALDQAQRAGDLAKAGELSYGTIPSLEKQLEEAQAVVGNAMLREDVVYDRGRDLILNAVGWLTQREALLGLRPRPREHVKLVLQDDQLARMSLMCLVGLPGFALLLGALVLWRRRA